MAFDIVKTYSSSEYKKGTEIITNLKSATENGGLGLFDTLKKVMAFSPKTDRGSDKLKEVHNLADLMQQIMKAKAEGDQKKLDKLKKLVNAL